VDSYIIDIKKYIKEETNKFKDELFNNSLKYSIERL